MWMLLSRLLVRTIICIVDELPALIEGNFSVINGVKYISGRSMGEHGALICALKNKNAYRSVSAFSPICNPTKCDRGRNCLTTYLGADEKQWQAYDASFLIQNGASVDSILIDQGGGQMNF